MTMLVIMTARIVTFFRFWSQDAVENRWRFPYFKLHAGSPWMPFWCSVYTATTVRHVDYCAKL